ncbi:MAG: outer membrane beta-barrel protein [Planctomycetota bacterium]
MKKMNALSLLAAVLFATAGLFGQGIRVTGGLGLAFMLDEDWTDDMSDGGAGISTNYGFDLFGDYEISDELSALLGLGYYIGSNEDSGVEIGVSSLVITAGARYQLGMDMIRPYVMGGLQYVSTTIDVEVSGLGSSDASDSAFGLLLGGGALYDLGNDLFVGAELRILVGSAYSDDEISDEVSYDNVTLFFFATKAF